MTGEELIEYIQRNHLEDYTFTVSHETGEDSYPIIAACEDHEKKTVELF